MCCLERKKYKTVKAIVLAVLAQSAIAESYLGSHLNMQFLGHCILDYSQQFLSAFPFRDHT